MSDRIGLINDGADRPTSGITRYTSELMSALDAQRAPVTILDAGNGSGRSDSVVLKGSRRAPGLLTIGQAEIAWYTRNQKLTLVHDPTGLAPLFMTPAKRISSIHDVIPLIFPEASTQLNRVVARWWLPMVVRRLDAVITGSQQSKDDIVRYLPVPARKIVVVPDGVDQRYHPIEQSTREAVLQKLGIDYPYILYVSAVEPRKKRKNLPLFLEAFARLRQWSDRWRLVVVGSVRRDYRPVFDVVERLRLEPHIHFTGFVADEDLPSVYSGADLFVLPTLYEGFGLPVLEAMACGAPVVTSNTSSIPEVAADAAILVDPRNVDAIVDGMKRVLSDPVLAEDLRLRGLARASQFSWNRTASETIAVYEQVLGRSITNGGAKCR